MPTPRLLGITESFDKYPDVGLVWKPGSTGHTSENRSISLLRCVFPAVICWVSLRQFLGACAIKAVSRCWTSVSALLIGDMTIYPGHHTILLHKRHKRWVSEPGDRWFAGCSHKTNEKCHFSSSGIGDFFCALILFSHFRQFLLQSS